MTIETRLLHTKIYFKIENYTIFSDRGSIIIKGNCFKNGARAEISKNNEIHYQYLKMNNFNN